jgi:hypothetical protein
MSLNQENVAVSGIVNRLLDNMALLVNSQTGRDGAELRHQIGDIRSNYYSMIIDGTFPSKLLACFTLALTANSKLDSLFVVHQGLFNETPVGEISSAVVQMAILFCLATESRMISALQFNSRDDVESMMVKMRNTFDTARLLAADSLDTTAYQKLIALAGSLINHLSSVARPLPRMVTFTLTTTLPALAVCQRVYYSADRSDEIIDENKIVHPAFCMREIRGLSA